MTIERLLLLGIFIMGSYAIQAQSADRLWLDDTLSECKKGAATHYVTFGERTADGVMVSMFRKDGSKRMEGYSRGESGLEFDGETTFYHRNGTIECKGIYMTGDKVGLWQRWDETGKEKAERTYSSYDNETMAFTFVDQMPVFTEGEEIFSDLLKHRITSCVSELAGHDKEVYFSFIISEEGSITPTKVTDGTVEIADERLAALTDLPVWKPGKKQGRPVRVLMTMPIKL